MKLSRLSLPTYLAALSILCFPVVSGEELANPVMPAPPSAQERIIKKIDFAAPTTVGAIVELIRKETDANIVTHPGVDKIVVPSLKLRDVTVLTAIRALCNAIDAASTPIECFSPQSSGDPKTKDNLIVISMSGANKPAPDIVSRAFLLPVQPDQDFDKQLDMTVDAVKSAIDLNARARYSEGSTHKAPLIEAHKATHLLLIAGERTDVDIAGQVITLLKAEAIPAAKSKDLPPNSIKVSVLGQVAAPGLYTVDADSNLAQVIAKAQGFTRLANNKKISVSSKAGAKTDVNFSTDSTSCVLQDGDVVTVGERVF